MSTKFKVGDVIRNNNYYTNDFDRVILEITNTHIVHNRLCSKGHRGTMLLRNAENSYYVVEDKNMETTETKPEVTVGSKWRYAGYIYTVDYIKDDIVVALREVDSSVWNKSVFLNIMKPYKEPRKLTKYVGIVESESTKSVYMSNIFCSKEALKSYCQLCRNNLLDIVEVSWEEKV